MVQRLIEHLPIIGHDIYQVGQVIDIVSQPCGPDPTILVKAFFANVPVLLWSLFKPDPVDFLTDKFGQVHRRRRKGRSIIQSVDIGSKQAAGGLNWAEFRGLQLSQRIGWYFSIADATTDFAINWMSLAYRYSGCQDPTTGYANCKRSTAFEWFSVGDPFQMGGGTASFSAGYNSAGSQVTKLLAGPRSFSGGASFVPATGNPKGGPATVEIRYFPSGGAMRSYNIDLSQKDAGGGQNGSTAQLGYNVLEPPGTYQLWVTPLPGYIRAASWHLNLNGLDNTNYGLEPDP